VTAGPAASGRTRENLAYFYPEIAAGGYTRVDGTVEFYTRVHSLIRPDMAALDIGAGRGGQIHDSADEFRRDLLTLQGKVARLTGADVDPVVLENPFLDHAEVIEPGKAMPFANEEFDLIYADWVLEHIATPGQFAGEIHRILRPGGWFCARTPNRWGFTGIVTNLIPSRFHAGIVGRLQPGRIEQDVFPTCYELNTRRRLRRHFPATAWQDCSYLHSAEPPYVQRSRLAMFLVKGWFKHAPAFFANNFFIFLRKIA
jgi:SAM-dependent methyltransferase